MEDKEIIKIVIDLLEKIKAKERKEAQKILKDNIYNYLEQMKPFSLKGIKENNLVDEGYYQLITILQEKLNNGDFDD